MKVRALIKKIYPDVKIPEYKTSGSSGLDLEAYIEEDITLGPNEIKLIPTGISVAVPNDFEIQIRPRSGLALKNNITVLNTPGTIDADYRGEIKIILINLGKSEFVIKKGDRIAQMVVCPIVKIEFENVENLPETVRGSGGFGSTGKN